MIRRARHVKEKKAQQKNLNDSPVILGVVFLLDIIRIFLVYFSKLHIKHEYKNLEGRRKE